MRVPLLPHIELSDLSIRFPILSDGSRSLKNTLVHSMTGGRIGEADGHKYVEALKNVNLCIRDGERVAVIGHNGAGKTTLLRVLHGIYPPTGGAVTVTGSIGSLINVSLGIDPQSTGRENIFLRSSLIGMPRSAILEKFDEIIAFSELGDYIDLPVKTYSSGMMLRLAFSIATAYPADILLMDEWLSVGDEQFRAKASERIESLAERTSILVVASHSPDVLRRTCSRAIWLEHGDVKLDGPVGSVCQEYFGR